MGEIVKRGDEVSELTRLAGEELGGLIGAFGEIHTGVSGRVFRFVGPVGRPVKVAHDAVAGRVYGGIASGARVAGRGAQTLAARRPAPDPEAVSKNPRGLLLLGILNGLVGDVLEREGSPLAQSMCVREAGQTVTIEREALRSAFPEARPRIAVFLHGLMETDLSWGATGNYGERLEDELPLTAVYLRYNTGRRISENGRSFAELLEALVEAWPVPVDHIDLVGHSMGGLVARSAAHQAGLEGARWPGFVRNVVSIGTPHGGAPLEEIVHVGSAALNLLPETRPFSRFLRRRSGGIRDLRRGSLVDDDWRDREPDALRAAVCQEVPLLEGATHYFVSASITRNPKHPLGRLIGDWLVLQPSASGRSRDRRLPFRDEDGFHLGGAHHFALLNHPEVYERLREWLSR